MTLLGGLNNRVIAGMLLYIERKNLVECDSNRFEGIDKTCSGGRDISSYGVDPMFKLGREEEQILPSTSSTTERTGARHAIHLIVYWCLLRRLPHSILGLATPSTS